MYFIKFIHKRKYKHLIYLATVVFSQLLAPIKTELEKIRKIERGDVLTFKAQDNQYKAIICTSTFIEKSPHSFTFLATNFSSEDKPSLTEIIQSNFYEIGKRKAEHFKYTDEQIQNMWNTHPEIKPYHIGTYGFVIWRKDFLKFSDKLELIGNLEIIENLDKNGSGSMNASDWEFLRQFFNEQIGDILQSRGQSMYRLKALLK